MKTFGVADALTRPGEPAGVIARVAVDRTVEDKVARDVRRRYRIPAPAHERAVVQ
jgi:hypothetical protein